MDAEQLYRRLGRLLATFPIFVEPLTDEQRLWLARASVLVKEAGADNYQWTWGLEKPSSEYGTAYLKTVLYRILAETEVKVPASVQGTFIPVGNVLDAFAAVKNLMEPARADILIVDPYMDETALTEFGHLAPRGVMLRVLTDAATRKATLDTAANRWVAQYGATLPIQVRLAPPRTLHDRAIFIDKGAAWTLTQSLKDFAKRSPGEIVRVDDIAPLKIAAYEEIWGNATIVV
jgi:hypothetical protein